MFDASIVIPVYNQLEYLKKVLYGYEYQSYNKELFEVIVIDDGSTDGLDRIKNFSDLIPSATINCKLIHTHNWGRSAARNEGIRVAESNIIIFNDADRIPEIDYIKKHLERQKHNDVVIGNSKNIWREISKITFPVNPDDRYIRESNYFSKIKSLCNDPDFYMNYRWLALLIGNASIKRESIINSGGFDEHFINWGLEHFDLGLRLQENNVHFIIDSAIENYHIPHNRNNKDNFNNALLHLEYLSIKYGHLDFSKIYEYLFSGGIEK